MANRVKKPATHEDIIETMVDFKKGLRTLDTGATVLSEQTGLTEDVARAYLRGLKKSSLNVTQIRGYSKEKSENPRRVRRANGTRPDDKIGPRSVVYRRKKLTQLLP